MSADAGGVRLEYHEGPFGMFPSYVKTLDEPTHIAYPAAQPPKPDNTKED